MKQGKVTCRDGSALQPMGDLVFERSAHPLDGTCSCCALKVDGGEPGVLVRSRSSTAWHWLCPRCTRSVVDAYRSAS